MDGLAEGARKQLPDGAAPLIDLAARWMHENGLTGPLAGSAIEFTFGHDGRVERYFVKTRGGRNDLLAAGA